ncbi:hypothetical protein FHR32_000658 [Streptosporangium album]|uniref:Uncharacterized protein n=1 Tax=Streptosporangium album TaxID=47479 RepID=A0A7W7RRL7_9ACTN|nr:hypothetical protein [Streptosporangium album]
MEVELDGVKWKVVPGGITVRVPAPAAPDGRRA